MAFFGTPQAFIGLDIGTSTLKLVELLDRRKRIEVTTYAQTNLPNLLLSPPPGDEEGALRTTANTLNALFEKARVTTDLVVAALPSSIVFSTVLTLPDMPEMDMDKAVHFAARDVVPANLDEMVLGWSRLGEQPHMDSPIKKMSDQVVGLPDRSPNPAASNMPASPAPKQPIFITAAPKNVVRRYTRLMEMVNVRLQALEVETFPLIRSLLAQPATPTMIVDLGDWVTTFHIIDRGTARVSHTVESGGHAITAALAQALGVTLAEAEQKKIQQGLSPDAPAEVREPLLAAMRSQIQQAQRVVEAYNKQSPRPIQKTILIGGGANMKGIATPWSEILGWEATVGNPWRGLSYPQQLDDRLAELGPKYAVAVGLALRGFTQS